MTISRKHTPLEAFNNAFGGGVAEWLRDVAEEHLTDDELAVLSNPDSTPKEREAIGYTVMRELLGNGTIQLGVYRKRKINVAKVPTEARELFAVGVFKVKPDLSWELVKEHRGKEIIDNESK